MRLMIFFIKNAGFVLTNSIFGRTFQTIKFEIRINTIFLDFFPFLTRILINMLLSTKNNDYDGFIITAFNYVILVKTI